MGGDSLLPFNKWYPEPRGRSPNDMNAFYCSPWAETPTGWQNAVWLRPSDPLRIKAVLNPK